MGPPAARPFMRAHTIKESAHGGAVAQRAARALPCRSLKKTNGLDGFPRVICFVVNVSTVEYQHSAFSQYRMIFRAGINLPIAGRAKGGYLMCGKNIVPTLGYKHLQIPL